MHANFRLLAALKILALQKRQRVHVQEDDKPQEPAKILKIGKKHADVIKLDGTKVRVPKKRIIERGHKDTWLDQMHPKDTSPDHTIHGQK